MICATYFYTFFAGQKIPSAGEKMDFRGLAQKKLTTIEKGFAQVGERNLVSFISPRFRHAFPIEF
jgi:hypothetical protein